jgi:DNA-binding LacI/PurR family transcriptional regulator/anti-anti-sigma regulatory factor
MSEPRDIATRRPEAIGVITHDLGGYYFGGMLNGIHQAACKAGVPLIVIREALSHHQIPLVSSDIVAGWIVLHPNETHRENLAKLCATKKPVIMVPVPLDEIPATLVQADNHGGMRDVVLHLIDHGHRRIAYVDHGPEVWSEQRFLGYCDAFDARGIAYDPELVLHPEVDTVPGKPSHAQRGQLAAQYLLEQGLPCTAVAAATDACALELMQIVQAAGYHVPEDLAVVGFDDVDDAQHASPPLTTVRSQFVTLGREAVKQLLAEIAGGHAARPQAVSVPTIVLHRRSCGCATLEELLVTSDADDAAGSWQTRLVRQLAQVLLYPLSLDPAISPAQIWQGANVLVAALDAALHEQQLPVASFEVMWQQAIQQTESLELHQGALWLLEDAAEQQLAISRADAQPMVKALLRQIRLDLIRARLAYEAESKHLLNAQVQSNYAVGMALLRSSGKAARSLGWLEHTPASWGCLGLWDTKAHSDAPTLTIAGVYDRNDIPHLVTGQFVQLTAFPPIDQLPTSLQQGQDLVILCPIRTQEHDWGVLALSGWFGQQLMTSTEDLTIQATLLGATLDRDAVFATLAEQQATLQESYTRERMMAQTIRELGCPIIPLLPGVLLVPLIGALDSERAQQIIGTTLEAIAAQQAQTILLDVTGVPIVDTQVANSLIQTARAAMLLGARVILVGIRPEIAQSIVGLGIDLKHLMIHSTLANAIRMLQIKQFL